MGRKESSLPIEKKRRWDNVGNPLERFPNLCGGNRKGGADNLIKGRKRKGSPIGEVFEGTHSLSREKAQQEIKNGQNSISGWTQASPLSAKEKLGLEGGRGERNDKKKPLFGGGGKNRTSIPSEGGGVCRKACRIYKRGEKDQEEKTREDVPSGYHGGTGNPPKKKKKKTSVPRWGGKKTESFKSAIIRKKKGKSLL